MPARSKQYRRVTGVYRERAILTQHTNRALALDCSIAHAFAQIRRWRWCRSHKIKQEQKKALDENRPGAAVLRSAAHLKDVVPVLVKPVLVERLFTARRMGHSGEED